MTTLDELYAERGDLLELKAIAELHDRPFYMDNELFDVNEQIEIAEIIAEFSDLAEKQAESKPTYDEIVREPKLLTPELRAENLAWWNDNFSDENVQKRLEALG